MKRLIKKYFIPHEGNEHKPHFLRPRATLLIVLTVLAIEVVFIFDAFIIVPSRGFLSLILPNVLVDGTNGSRASSDILPLKSNPLLEEAARRKAEDMAEKGYFAHKSPEGLSPWYWLSKVGYDFSSAGENLAISFSDSKDVSQAWLNSPSHRANILNAQFTEIGIGTAEGVYQGQTTTFIVQFFGRPAAISSVFMPRPVISATPSPEEMFIALAPPPPPIEEQIIEEVPIEAGSTPETPVVASESIDLNANEATILQRVTASPRRTSNMIYLFVGSLASVSVLLKVFIKNRVQHPLLIANGIFVILILTGLFFLNRSLVLSAAAIF